MEEQTIFSSELLAQQAFFVKIIRISDSFNSDETGIWRQIISGIFLKKVQVFAAVFAYSLSRDGK